MTVKYKMSTFTDLNLCYLVTLFPLFSLNSSLKRELKNVEKCIFDLEEAYLEDSTSYSIGNVIFGWDTYFNRRSVQGSM